MLEVNISLQKDKPLIQIKSGSDTNKQSMGLNTAALYPVINKYFGEGVKAKIYKKVTNCLDGTPYTVISSENPFYYHYCKDDKDRKSNIGCCHGITVNTKNKFDKKNLPLLEYFKCTSIISMNTYGNSSLTNCVGYVNGRLQELWIMGIVAGLITYNNGKFYVGNTEIIGKPPVYNHNYDKLIVLEKFNNYLDNYKLEAIAKSFDTGHGLYSGSAQYWNWSSSPGWEIIPRDIAKSYQPTPGMAINWTHGTDGHIAVIEDVGVDSKGEYIIISESGWNYSWSYNNKIVTTDKIYKGKDGYYNWNSAYPFKSFLITPVTQVYGGNGFMELETKYITNEAIEAYASSKVRLAGEKIYAPLKVGEEVRVDWIGNSEKDGSGKVISMLDTTAIVTKHDTNAEYGYKIKIKFSGEELGWFKRDALYKLKGDNMVYADPEIKE